MKHENHCAYKELQSNGENVKGGN